jgi:hypothetical protein
MSIGSIAQTDEPAKECARCLTWTLAVELLRFTFRGRVYEIPLCPMHVAMAEREFGAWIRLARELTMDRTARPAAFPSLAPVARSEARSEPAGPDRRMIVPFPVVRGEVIDHDAAERASVAARRPGAAPYVTGTTGLGRAPQSAATPTKKSASGEGTAKGLFQPPTGQSDPLDDWTFSGHAMDRMRERHISTASVWQAMRHPIEVSPEREGKTKYHGERATVVVDELDQVIVTVGYPRSHPLYHSATD